MGVLRNRPTISVSVPEIQAALEDMERRSDMEKVYGTSAPTSETAGKIYFQIESTATAGNWYAVTTIYIKV